MENLKQNQQPNEIIGVPHIVGNEQNELEQAALPVDKPREVKIAEEKAEAKIGETQLQTVRKILKSVTEAIEAASRLLDAEDKEAVSGAVVQATSQMVERTDKSVGKILEGVFDGESMVAQDGAVYSVPANYASKSKLVEGDLMKLTITPKGAFIYKQIGPTERDRVRGTLLENKEIGEYAVACDDKVYRILKASITYFKGEEGDEVVLLVPKNAPSRWAAVENVVKKRI